LYTSDIGAFNTGVGQNAGRDLTNGCYNTLIGQGAGRSIVTGSCNTAIGNGSFRSNAAGICNTGVGVNSGNTSTGSNNTFIGAYAVDQNAAVDNNIAIGYAAGTTYQPLAGLSNQIVMGNAANTNAFIPIAWTVTSDARRKIVEGPIPLGLDFVTKLNPVQYKFKDIETGEVTDDQLRYGLLAQEVQVLEVDPENPVIVHNRSEYLGMNYESLIPVLINAVKEITERLDALEGKT
jgi:hypothetical protein